MNKNLLVVFLLTLSPLLVSCGCRGRHKQAGKALSPAEGLEMFLMAQENGDKKTVLSLVVEKYRDDFKKILDTLSRDDLIATGLQFREEKYVLDERSDNMAVFWSESSKLYLVMMFEDGLWRIDPKKTDQMNADIPMNY